MKKCIAALLLLVAFYRGRCEDEYDKPRAFNKPFTAEIKQLKLSADNFAVPLWWDGKMVTAITRPVWTFCYFTAHDFTLRRLVVPGIDELVSLGDWLGHPYALGKIGKFYVLLLKQGGAWKTIRFPDSIDTGYAPSFIPSTRGLVFFARNSLFIYEGEKWRRVKLPPIPKKLISKYSDEPDLPFDLPGDASQLYGTQFFTGWNMMRYGGMLCMFDIAHPENSWKKYTAGIPMRDPKALMDNVGITSMTVDSRGRLWISQGDNEVCSRGLYCYDGAKWTALIRGEWDKDHGPVVLGGITEIIDVICGPDNKVYTLSDTLGIHMWNDYTPSHVLAFDFSAISTDMDPRTGKQLGVTIPCCPLSLARDARGNFFVMTAYYGILCFIKDGGRYHLRQIVAPGKI